MFYRHWFDARSVPRTFVFQRYEALHDDAPVALRATLDFLGVSDAPASTIDDAIRFASFDNLRRAEAADAFRSASLRAANPAALRTFEIDQHESDEDVASGLRLLIDAGIVAGE